MRPYIPQNNTPVKGMILLVIGSIILGLVIGTAAYFVTRFIYLVVIIPLVIGLIGVVLYDKLLVFVKVRHIVLTTFVGLMIGIITAVTYHAIPYFIERNNFITEVKEMYGVDAREASCGFNEVLSEETGSRGLLGYMKLRANTGDQYTNYVIVNSIAIELFSFSFRSTQAWLYWGFEMLLIALPMAWAGYNRSRNFFNHSADDWYLPLPDQIGSVPIENKAVLTALFQENSLLNLSELMVAEGDIPHPTLEIYEQHSKNRKGDTLLVVKETARQSPTKVNRTTIARWEITPEDYSPFIEAVNRKINESDVTP